MGRFNSLGLVVLFLGLITLCGCQDLVPRDTPSLFIPRFQRSEICGFVAGLGTTFAAVPDLVAMLRRRSSAGTNPRMAAIMGIFQILRFVDCVATRDRMKRDRSVDQFSERRRVPSLRAQKKNKATT
jgi:hypothetical protein